MIKTFVKNLLDRRFPQLMGSYFVGATSLLLFLDWLVVKYHFTDFVTSLALFGIISIIPTVAILAYFHGAPGKDEWTKIEKYGIPFNFLFIAIVLLIGNKYNIWEDPPPDHSKVYDNFIVHISSNQKNIDQLKITSLWSEYGERYTDFIYPLDNEELEMIRSYVNVNLKKAFMNYKEITINFPDNKKEISMIDDFVSFYYLLNLDDMTADEEIKKKNIEEGDIVHDNIVDSFEYFNNKHNTYVDKIYYLELFKAKLSKKGKMLRNFSKLKNLNSEVHIYGYLTTSYGLERENNNSITLISIGNYGGFDPEEEETIEDLIYESVLEKIKTSSFGSDIGKVVSVLDSNLVNIKLENLDVIKGTDLICLGRRYTLSSSSDRDEVLKQYIEDNKIIYNYLSKHPNQIEKAYNDLDVYIDYTSTEEWIEDQKDKIDSLEVNFQKIINNVYWESTAESWDHNEFRYYLRILNVQDSIATAKITGSIFPFSFPEIGDKVQVK